MDDLDHSVLIAERDWDSFYQESEECSIQQASLAGLDDSGLSDIDDDSSTQPVSSPNQTNTGKLNEVCGAASQAPSAVEEGCEVEKPSEDSEGFCYREALESTAPISLNHSMATCANLTADPPDILLDNASNTNNFKECNQSQSENEFSHVTDEPITITSSSCNQNTDHANSAEGEMVTKLTESSATPKKEKERWFVTVNNSPVQQSSYSANSGQKKGRKKKTSRKLSQQSRTTGEQQCHHSNNEKEAEDKKNKKERRKVQNKFKEPIHRCSENVHCNIFPNNVHDKKEATTIQHFDLAPTNGPELSSTTKTDKVTTENPEIDPYASSNSQPSSNKMQSLQLQANDQQVPITQFVYYQSTVMGSAKDSKSNTDITTQNQQPANSNSSDVTGDSHENCSRHFLRVSSTKSLSDEQQGHQEFSTQYNEEEKLSSSLQHAQNQEPPNESLKAAVGPSRPIYALSSFWDEMEKLTINDILHLRVANRPQPSESVTPENPARLHDTDLMDSADAGLQDSTLVDDSADSGYFTHLDDSKPDRSSCEFSTFSDFDEEFLQIINTSATPSPEPQSLKQSESFLKSAYISQTLTEQELELTTVNNESSIEDIIMLCPQDGLPLYLYPASETQQVFFSQNPDSNENPFALEITRKTPSPVLSVGDILDDQCLMQLSEIFAKEEEKGLQTMTPGRCSPVLSFYSSNMRSVPETYDDFFSDFEVGNLFFPFVKHQTVPIPIFSSSRSVVRDMVFPEVEELIEPDFKDNNCPIQDMTRFGNQQERSTDSSRTPNLFFYTSQRKKWRSLLSLRRFGFIWRGSTWSQKVNSWIFPRKAKKLTSYISRAQPVPYLHFQALQHCAEQQKPALISKRESFLFSIKQSDMCLVCIAFASWVHKTSNLQSTDMWKAALLANVSALSAIQYLRKYKKKEETEDDP